MIQDGVLLERTFKVKLKDDNGADPVKSKGRVVQVMGAASSVWSRKKCCVSQELPLHGAVALERFKFGEIVQKVVYVLGQRV